MRRLLRVAVTLVFIVLIMLITAVFVFTRPLPASPAALDALQSGVARSGETVIVSTETWLTFKPSEGITPSAGLVFYPGGLVDPQAYAPLAVDIAAHGYLVVIVPMPLNLAVIDPQAADAVISAHPEISTWTVGGHSLGGAMAARYAAGNPDVVQGLALWASYPEDGLIFSEMLNVVSIYGTNDGVADAERILAAKSILPANSHFVAVEGGNHAQFGYYGAQRGDNPASIAPDAQRDQVVRATVQLLQQIVS